MTSTEIVLALCVAALVALVLVGNERYDKLIGQMRMESMERTKFTLDAQRRQSNVEAERMLECVKVVDEMAGRSRVDHQEVIGTLIEELTANRVVHTETLRMLERALNPPFEPTAALPPDILAAAARVAQARTSDLPPEVTGDWSGEAEVADPFPLDNAFDGFMPRYVAGLHDEPPEPEVDTEPENFRGDWPDPDATDAEDILQMQRLGEDIEGPLEPTPEATLVNPSRAATFPAGDYPEVP